MNARLVKFAAPLLVALGMACATHAQDEAEAEAGATPATPRASEPAKLAAKVLLLGIAEAGDALIAVGDYGNILRSTDGQTWTQVASPVNVTLTAIAFADAQHGWAVGHDASILRTTDGGQTWTVQQFRTGKDEPVLNVLALDAQRAFVVGAFGLFQYTTDGGASWNEVDAPALREEGFHLNTVQRLGDGSLFVAGEMGLIGRSTDGGASWTRLTLPYEGSLFGALPRGDKGALVFGLRGNVWVSEDVAGGAWTPVDLGSVQSMYGGTVLPDGRVVLVGADEQSFVIASDGSVQAGAARAESGSGSLSGVVAWKGRLYRVGEAGVAQAAMP
jgi:photosystem II stability/assembly factor-like uncharacterized protein